MINESTIAIAVNAAATAIRTGKLEDIEASVRAALAGHDVSEDRIDQLRALGLSYYTFGESVRYSAKRGNGLPSFHDVPDLGG